MKYKYINYFWAIQGNSKWPLMARPLRPPLFLELHAQDAFCLKIAEYCFLELEKE